VGERRRGGAQPRPQRRVGGLVVLAGHGHTEVRLQGAQRVGRLGVEVPGDVAVVVAERLQRLLQLGRHHGRGQQVGVAQGDEVDVVRRRLEEEPLDDGRRHEPCRRDVAGGVDAEPAARAGVGDPLARVEQGRAVGERRARATAVGHRAHLGPDRGGVGGRRGDGGEGDRHHAVVHLGAVGRLAVLARHREQALRHEAVTGGPDDSEAVRRCGILGEQLLGDVRPRHPVEADDAGGRVAGGGELLHEHDPLPERGEHDDVGVGRGDGGDLLLELDSAGGVQQRVGARAPRRQLGRQLAGELRAVHVVAPDDHHRAGRRIVGVDVHDPVGDRSGRVVVAHRGAEERGRDAVGGDGRRRRRRRADEQLLIAGQGGDLDRARRADRPDDGIGLGGERLQRRRQRLVDGLLDLHRRDGSAEHAPGRVDVVERHGQPALLTDGELVERGVTRREDPERERRRRRLGLVGRDHGRLGRRARRRRGGIVVVVIAGARGGDERDRGDGDQGDPAHPTMMEPPGAERHTRIG
jgi:hypothetical protein